MATPKTKAVLYTEGEAQNFQLYTGKQITKEKFHEQDFEAGTSTLFSLAMGKEITSKVIKVSGLDVATLVFEDGSIYRIGKGMDTIISDDQDKYVADMVTELTAKAEAKKAEKKSKKAE